MAMNQPLYSLSVKAIVRGPDGRCLLLRRSGASHTHAEFREFPGGKLDPGERPDEALLREIREETGLQVLISRVAGAAESALPDCKVAYLFFEAAALDTEVSLSSEHDAYEWVSPGELHQYLLCPQFQAFAREYARHDAQPVQPAMPD